MDAHALLHTPVHMGCALFLPVCKEMRVFLYYLFTVYEVSACLPGNACALLMPDSREEAIRTFTGNVKRIIRIQMKKAGGDTPV